ncbi:uncharacterized protein METZ01_LOCUS382484, partial [marine metagenome]
LANQNFRGRRHIGQTLVSLAKGGCS